MVSNHSYQENGRSPTEMPPGYPPAYSSPPYPPPYPPPPGWEGYPGGYYPPPPPPKKKLGAGAITAIILAAIVFLGAAAAAVYLLLLKKDMRPEPTHFPTSESRRPRTTAPAETEPGETEPQETEPETELSVYAEWALTLDPYEIQHLGANPVYYYQHPTLDIAIDLRGEEEAARMMFVFPTENGFTVTHRQTISYQFNSLRDYEAGHEAEGITVWIDLLSEEQKQKELAHIEEIESQGTTVRAAWVPVQGGELLVRDNFTAGPGPAWTAKELYQSPVFFDYVYLSQHLLDSPQPGISINETPFDSDAEWERIVGLLHFNPAEFEWRYCMPPYATDIMPGAALPNADFLTILLTKPIYEYGALDLNGDGFMEYLVHCSCYATGDFPYYGYWVVFTETPYGLRLIDFSVAGESSLIYCEDHFYFLDMDARENFSQLGVEVHSIPVRAADQRSFEYIRLTDLGSLMDAEAAGEDMDWWNPWVVVPQL